MSYASKLLDRLVRCLNCGILYRQKDHSFDCTPAQLRCPNCNSNAYQIETEQEDLKETAQ